MPVSIAVLALFLSLILPVAAGLFLGIRKKLWKPLLLGVLCMFFFQFCTRIPILIHLETWSAGWLLFEASRPVLYMLALGLSAGVFEECGRYIIMRKFLPDVPFAGGVAFGIGHGGIEALWISGMSLVSVFVYGLEGSSASNLFWSGAERIFAFIAQIGFSVTVWRSVSLKKPLLLALAVLLHGLLDFAAVYFMSIGMDVWAVEAIVAAFALALLAYTIWTGKRERNGL